MSTARGHLCGFTLVELLVVITVIAVVMAMLLPALQAARRQAEMVRCMAELQQAGHAFVMYSGDYRGYFPVSMAWRPPAYIVDSKPRKPALWFHLVEKYLVRESDHARWGCPSWNEPSLTNARMSAFGLIHNSMTVFDRPFDTIDCGYGMNVWPEFTAHSFLDRSDVPKKYWWGGYATPNGYFNNPMGWHKATVWQRYGPSERLLLADSMFWNVQSHVVPVQERYPTSVRAQINFGNVPRNQINPPQSLTNVDLYRHGVMPPPLKENSYLLDPWKGRVSYNILYVDGHVENHKHGREAYYSIRMRFPG